LISALARATRVFCPADAAPLDGREKGRHLHVLGDLVDALADVRTP